MNLMVIADFDGHRRGEVISDAFSIAMIEASAHAHCVVPIASDATPPGPAAAQSIPVED